MSFLRFQRNSDFKVLNPNNNLTMRGLHTSQSICFQSFSPVIIGILFFSHHKPPGTTQYPFRVSSKTEFPNWAIQCKLLLSEMNANLREQFLGTLLSGFYFRIFHFSPQSSMHCKISLFQFYRNSVQTLPYEKRSITP